MTDKPGSKVNWKIKERDPTHPRYNCSMPVAQYTTPEGLALRPCGCGDHVSQDGHGWPILLVREGGKWVLRVWGDINQEDPTHTIDLAGAEERLREPEPLSNEQFAAFMDSKGTHCPNCDGEHIDRHGSLQPLAGNRLAAYFSCDRCRYTWRTIYTVGYVEPAVIPRDEQLP
jgi:hypothetical protein